MKYRNDSQLQDAPNILLWAIVEIQTYRLYPPSIGLQEIIFEVQASYERY